MNKKTMKIIETYKNIEKDQENPLYLFSNTKDSILVDIINKKIDIVYLAKMELANRGKDKKGFWSGFEKAKEIHGV